MERPDFAVDLNNEPGAASWPIESATFVLLPTNPTSAAQSLAVRKMFGWAFADGDTVAMGLKYVPLPASTKSAIEKTWDRIKPRG